MDGIFGFDSELPNSQCNQLQVALEDDNIDEFNDETFGEAIEEVDWEEQYDLLAGNFSNSAADQPELISGDVEQLVENSISQLVVEDDDEIFGDPAVLGHSQVKANSHEGNSFNTSSSSLAHVSFLNSDCLVTPNVKNIWGSPLLQHDVNENKENEEGLKGLLRILKNGPEEVDQLVVHTNHPFEARTVEEIEKGVVQCAVPIDASSLESSDAESPLNMLEHRLHGSDPVSLPLHRLVNPAPIGTPPRPMGPTSLRLQDSNHLPRVPAHLPPRVPPHLTRMPIHGRPPFITQGDMWRHHPPPAQAVGFRNLLPPPGWRGRPPMPPPQIMWPRPTMRGPLPPPMGLMPLRHQSSSNELLMEGDPYDNLMTQSEKDWIIKIQLLQLQTDNPYADDYYHTIWSMRKVLENQSKRTDNGVKCEKKGIEMVLPELAKSDNRSYQPMQFEGSLGKLTASSVRNPRQILDVSSSTHAEGQQQMRRHKQLLMHIERGYDMFLEIDDLEKKSLALPISDRPAISQRRDELIQKLVDQFICDNEPGKFQELLTMKKGIKLLARTFALLNKDMKLILLKKTFKHLQTLLRKNQHAQSLEILCHSLTQVFSTMDFGQLVVLSESLQDPTQSNISNQTNVVLSALENVYGATILWNFIHRASEISSAVSVMHLVQTDVQSWNGFLTWFAECISRVPVERVCSPLFAFPRLSVYFKKSLKNDLLEKISSHLKAVSIENVS